VRSVNRQISNSSKLKGIEVKGLPNFAAINSSVFSAQSSLSRREGSSGTELTIFPCLFAMIAQVAADATKYMSKDFMKSKTSAFGVKARTPTSGVLEVKGLSRLWLNWS